MNKKEIPKKIYLMTITGTLAWAILGAISMQPNKMNIPMAIVSFSCLFVTIVGMFEYYLFNK